MKEKVSFRWVKEQYFSNPEKTIRIKKGEVLLDHNQVNHRLFLVHEGKMHGYLIDSGLESYPILEATTNKFIGVYSYFSDDNKSYTRVVAAEDSVIGYYDTPLLEHSQEEWMRLAPFLISVVVNELYNRQHFAKQMALDRHNDVQRLLRAEKMATLGQMAAGIAHELNNSIGVIDGGMDHIKTFFNTWVKMKQDNNYLQFFNLGYEKGQYLSSEEARKRRKNYEKIKELTALQVKRLAKTGIETEIIKSHVKEDVSTADEIYKCWEAGCTLHDMKIASRHSVHVVRSVKQLGVNEHSWSEKININDSIREALVILKNLTKHVETEFTFDEGQPQSSGYYGQLIQIWINIIKNAIESMVGSGINQPLLKIKTSHSKDWIQVEIKDNGPGIPAKIVDKIFEPSFTTKIGGLSFGLGLGLSIVQRIITEHDAQIHVSSQPGETTFTIKFPLNY